MTATFHQFQAEQGARNTIELNVTKWSLMLIDALKDNFREFSIRGHQHSIERGDSLEYHLSEQKLLEANILPIDYIIESGRKYHKIILIDGGGSRSVSCFVDKKTGEIYKAASFRAPAKHVRYDFRIIEQREWVLANADWAGGWLYLR